MSRVFDAYARYYDLLYRDKQYAVEAAYVAAHIREHAPEAERLLELGCGTGAHAEQLVRIGYTVHGVDLSEAMLARAQGRKAGLPPEVAARLSFGLGDIRTLRTGESYDAVISLFHVFSYQTSNDDLRAAFATAKAHLRSGGILFFDCWYGPAVLTLKPSITVRRFEDNAIRVTRIAEPTLHAADNVVTVDYEVIVAERAMGTMHQLFESHRMRYLFSPEVRALCADAGLTVVNESRWMGEGPPDTETWAACYVARACELSGST